jgi:hypothetical protein
MNQPKTKKRLGLKVAVADIEQEGLSQIGKILVGLVGEANVLVVPTDVSKLDEVVRFRDKIYEAWGEVRINANRT